MLDALLDSFRTRPADSGTVLRVIRDGTRTNRHSEFRNEHRHGHRPAAPGPGRLAARDRLTRALSWAAALGIGGSILIMIVASAARYSAAVPPMPWPPGWPPAGDRRPPAGAGGVRRAVGRGGRGRRRRHRRAGRGGARRPVPGPAADRGPPSWPSSRSPLLPPAGSTDTLSYATFGRIAVLGHNPYVMTPNQLSKTSDPIGQLAIQLWRSRGSLYGPLATAEQWAAAKLGGTSAAADHLLAEAVERDRVPAASRSAWTGCCAPTRPGGPGRTCSGRSTRWCSGGWWRAATWTCSPRRASFFGLIAGAHPAGSRRRPARNRRCAGPRRWSRWPRARWSGWAWTSCSPTCCSPRRWPGRCGGWPGALLAAAAGFLVDVRAPVPGGGQAAASQALLIAPRQGLRRQLLPAVQRGVAAPRCRPTSDAVA